MSRLRILIADDHTLMAEALSHLLSGEFDVVGRVADGHALLEAAETLRPDVAVVDIGMPLLNGLDAAGRLKAAGHDLKVIVLTQNREPRLAVEAFRRGLSGYVLKDAAASELVAAIRSAQAGRWYNSPALGDVAAERLRGDADDRSRELSAREREVLQLLAEGRPMKEVATLLGISPRTVEFHKYRIMQMLGLKSGAELVQYAIKHGIIGP